MEEVLISLVCLYLFCIILCLISKGLDLTFLTPLLLKHIHIDWAGVADRVQTWEVCGGRQCVMQNFISRRLV